MNRATFYPPSSAGKKGVDSYFSLLSSHSNRWLAGRARVDERRLNWREVFPFVIVEFQFSESESRKESGGGAGSDDDCSVWRAEITFKSLRPGKTILIFSIDCNNLSNQWWWIENVKECLFNLLEEIFSVKLCEISMIKKTVFRYLFLNINNKSIANILQFELSRLLSIFGLYHEVHSFC